MAVAQFDVLIVFNTDEVLLVIPGIGRGLLKQLKEHTFWETILEEVDIDLLDEVKSIEDLQSIVKDNNEDYSFNIDIHRNIVYKSR